MDLITPLRRRAFQIGIDGLVSNHGANFFAKVVEASIPPAIQSMPEDRYHNLILELEFASRYYKESSAYLHAVEESLAGNVAASAPAWDDGPSPRDDLFEQAADNYRYQRDLESSIVWTSARKRLELKPSERYNEEAGIIAQSTRDIVRADYWKFGVEFTPGKFHGTSREAQYYALTNLGITGKFAKHDNSQTVFAKHYLFP